MATLQILLLLVFARGGLGLDCYHCFTEGPFSKLTEVTLPCTADDKPILTCADGEVCLETSFTVTGAHEESTLRFCSTPDLCRDRNAITGGQNVSRFECRTCSEDLCNSAAASQIAVVCILLGSLLMAVH